MKILVIDDVQLIREWFLDVLEPLGHEVRLVADAESALDQFHETRFDLAFFDHDLSGKMNGSQLASQILEHPKKYKRPRLVWVHSHNLNGALNIEAKFKAAGIECWLEQYIHCIGYKQDFKNTVEALLEGKPIPSREFR